MTEPSDMSPEALAAENRRLRLLLATIQAHLLDNATPALFEMGAGDGRIWIVACGPAGDEERLAREAATTFATLINAEEQRVTLGEMRTSGVGHEEKP